MHVGAGSMRPEHAGPSSSTGQGIACRNAYMGVRRVPVLVEAWSYARYSLAMRLRCSNRYLHEYGILARREPRPSGIGMVWGGLLPTLQL